MGRYQSRIGVTWIAAHRDCKCSQARSQFHKLTTELVLGFKTGPDRCETCRVSENCRKVPSTLLPRRAMPPACKALMPTVAVSEPTQCRAFMRLQLAHIAVRTTAERDLEQVFLAMAARWFSTVRWLIFRSAAMFLLGWPAAMSSRISC